MTAAAGTGSAAPRAPWQRTLALFIAALLLAAIASIARAPLSEGQQADDFEILDIEVDRDRATLTVATPDWLREDGVGPGSFLVSVGGRIVSPEVEPLAGEQLDVVLAIDRSGSMRGEPLAAAQQSARRFVSLLPEGARVAVMSFANTVRIDSQYTSDPAEVIAAIERIDAGGETALFAAAEQASELAASAQGLPVVVLLTDGANTVDLGSIEAATEALSTAGAAVQAISIASDESDPRQLRSIVRGFGQVSEVDDLAALEKLYVELAEGLQNFYRLTIEAGSASGPTNVVVQAADITRARGATATESVTVSFVNSGTGSSDEPGGGAIAGAERPTEATTALNAVSVERGSDALLRWGSTVLVAAGLALFFVPLLLNRSSGGQSLRRPSTRRSAQKPLQAYLGSPDGPAIGQTSLRTRVVHGLERRFLQGGIASRLRGALERAGWQLRNLEFTAIVGIVALVALLGGSLMSWPFGIALALLIVGLIVVAMGLAASRRRQLFEEQLNGTLQMLAGALRAGYSLPQAFAFVAGEAPAPTSEEFTRISLENRLGVDLIDAAEATAVRTRSEDFQWVVEGTAIARDVGGDLAEVLDNVSNTIRTRAHIKRQVKTLSAEGRVSAWILGILPLPMLLWQLAVNRDYTMLLFTNALGLTIFTASVTLLLVGIWWMRRLVQIEY